MMHPNELEFQRMRRQDMLREAEHAAHSKPAYAAALAKVGDMMVDMGTSLQERYGDLSITPPAQTPAKNC